MSSCLRRCLLAALFSVCAATEAHADGFDVRQFYPIAGSEGVFSVESSQPMGHLQYDIKLLTDYANTPLRMTVDGDLEGKLEHLVSMTFSASLGIQDIVEVGLSVPFVPYVGFDDTYLDVYRMDGSEFPETTVMGDMQVRAKARILKREDYGGFGLGAGLILSIPTGNEDSLVGDVSLWGRPYIAADYEIGPVEMMANFGFSFHKKAEYFGYESSHSFHYGFGVNYHVIEDWLDLKGEIFGETPLSDKASEDGDNAHLNKSHYNAAEFLLGAKLMTPIDLHLTFGAGAGMGDAVKNPKYHLLFGIEYSPSNVDTDEDGIVDRRDWCPTLAGLDEFHGCPDPDVDHDEWCAPFVELDKHAEEFGCKRSDYCPEVAGLDEFSGCPEADGDHDGWCAAWVDTPELAAKYNCKQTDECEELAGLDEFKGCPNPDSDSDAWCDPWIKDQAGADKYQCKLTDRCPQITGLDDFQGCPEADLDGDGLCAPFVEEMGVFEFYFCSGKDLCPDAPEDFDDFEDEDGCPDVDNDHDGICDPWVKEQGLLDAYAGLCRGLDKCPNEPETINGKKDDDGCPDKGKQVVFVHEDKIEIKDKIYFANNKSTIQKKSFSLLNQIAASIMANPDIKHISIEGHTDDTGTYEKNLVLSRQRAEAVVDYLVKHGIAADRLSAIGFGPDKPIDPAKTKKARALNRRVEFVITDRESRVKTVEVEEQE